VGPGDRIPVNAFKNVELELLNPGLVHVDIRGIAAVAKKLGIPYAPCMLGFEGQGGTRVPTVRGIVVHEHNGLLLREAGVEVVRHAEHTDAEKRRKVVFRRWKKLLNGLLTKDRLELEYG
jgi:xeroderma pigmentosum group C-complementing protein